MKVEAIVRRVVAPADLRIVVSNLGSTPDLSSIYTSNSAPNTAFVQVSLKDGHRVGSYAYMDRMREALRREAPELTAYFQSGGLVDAVLNQGIPAPVDVQVSANDLRQAFDFAEQIRTQASLLPEAIDVFIPPDVRAPSLRLDINRYHASEMGLSEHEVVGNVITALTSNAMIAPSYWVDPRTGNDYLLTVQYPEDTVKSLADLRSIPIRSASQENTAQLDTIADVREIQTPTEVDHYQLRRVIDVFVSPRTEELSRLAAGVDRIVARLKHPANVIIRARGIVGAMRGSFRSFGIGLILSVVLVYLVLVAQFKSFLDPVLILLAVPPGLTGVILVLTATGTTLNIMSLMGVVMMVGVVVSNSILIVEFTHRLIADGMPLREAVQFAARVRLRPILMTSIATVIGLIPMALALGAGSESYAPLARSIIGGMVVSVALTVFIVPAGFYLAYRNRRPPPPARRMRRLPSLLLVLAGLGRPGGRRPGAGAALARGGARHGAAQPPAVRRRPTPGPALEGGPQGGAGGLLPGRQRLPDRRRLELGERKDHGRGPQQPGGLRPLRRGGGGHPAYHRLRSDEEPVGGRQVRLAGGGRGAGGDPRADPPQRRGQLLRGAEGPVGRRRRAPDPGGARAAFRPGPGPGR